ncbi:hypothetical protein PthBH41_12090 [Parageobacillus thermoglucosidasius]|nr:hypothetical protein PthBH41_12090 [Parageobacillus thermoglucosidasius]
MPLSAEWITECEAGKEGIRKLEIGRNKQSCCGWKRRYGEHGGSPPYKIRLAGCKEGGQLDP